MSRAQARVGVNARRARNVRYARSPSVNVERMSRRGFLGIPSDAGGFPLPPRATGQHGLSRN